MKYRIIKTWDGRYTVQAWSVYNFDGIPDHIWKDRITCDTLGQAFDNLFLIKGEKTPETYFELTHDDNGTEVYNYFSDFEQATEYADEHGATQIDEIGGAWDEFNKCEFCGDWFTAQELKADGVCNQCYQASKSHGG